MADEDRDEDESALVLGAAVEPPDPAAAAPGAPKGTSGTGRSAAVVTAGILLSRLAGLVRQRVTAHYFGTSALADAITAAFRVGNITQNLLGEGTLSASFIPVYARLRAAGKDKDAARFARSALGLLGAVALAASALGVLLAPWLTLVVAAGFDPSRIAVTVKMVRIVFPMTALLAIAAWALGVLNAHRRFFLPYAAPVLWSLAQIAGLVVMGGVFHVDGEDLAIALAVSALAGAVLQTAVLLPAARRLLGGLRPAFDTRDPAIREAAAKLPSAIAGRGVLQLSSLIDMLLVSFLGAGANAAFGYAQTIFLLPMSLLGTGEAAAALPEMASETAEEDRDKRDAKVRARVGSSLARVVTLAMPSAAAFALLGKPIITVLLRGGSFDQRSTDRVAELLFCYAFALVSNAVGRVLSTTSFALGDTRSPARFATIRVVVSTLLSLVLMQRLDALGVVLGGVLASWVEMTLLARLIRGKLGGLDAHRVPWAKVTALSAMAALPAFLTQRLAGEAFASSLLGSAVVLAIFCAVFAIAAPALGLFDVRSLLRRRR